MLVFLNGQIVPEEEALVSVFDRAFLYGDGLFETLRVRNGNPFRWAQHLERLERGARYLSISLPFPPERLRQAAAELVRRNQMPDALLRLTLSRGIGPRGYSPKGAERPLVVMTLHPAPPLELQTPVQWRVVTASVRLPANDPLAQFKTCNKLSQILARAQADAARADEALLLNTDGFVVEASAGNLFWLKGGTVCAPPLASGILPGVTRAAVLELCASLELPVAECNVAPGQLHQAEGVFLSLSSFGIVEVLSLDGQSLRRSPLVERVGAAYRELLDRETRPRV